MSGRAVFGDFLGAAHQHLGTPAVFRTAIARGGDVAEIRHSLLRAGRGHEPPRPGHHRYRSAARGRRAWAGRVGPGRPGGTRGADPGHRRPVRRHPPRPAAGRGRGQRARPSPRRRHSGADLRPGPAPDPPHPRATRRAAVPLRVGQRPHHAGAPAGRSWRRWDPWRIGSRPWVSSWGCRPGPAAAPGPARPSATRATGSRSWTPPSARPTATSPCRRPTWNCCGPSQQARARPAGGQSSAGRSAACRRQ